MSAAGKVCTGYSSPFVAEYEATAGTGGAVNVSYSNGQELARGVGIELQITTTDGVVFYANNGAAESANGKFQSGKANLTVDGLFIAAERLIMGLGEAAQDGFTDYDDDQEPPYIGLGVVGRFMSDGVTTYTPFILPKIKFSVPNRTMNTSENTVNFQTQALEADILRDDTAKHKWLRVGGDETTEAAAIAKIKTFLNIT